MSSPRGQEYSYFPGCSLETTAQESNRSLMRGAAIMGLRLIELEDWNCCGSSSLPTLSKPASLGMAARNLSLAPPHRPLVAMCPRCLHYLRSTLKYLKEHPRKRLALEKKFDRPIDTDLEVIHFLEVLDRFGLARLEAMARRSLKPLRFVPYYGCTLYRPPHLERHHYFQGDLDRILVALGAAPVNRALAYRCCGSFLSVTNPEVVTPVVNEIMTSAVAAGANCLVTICAMCQLNLEIRSTVKKRVPVFHFSEVLALALGADDYEDWFDRHLVNPRPLVQQVVAGG
ncbi:MAG: hypothetical protein FJ128_11990 [Deltaproteobacteria bacterium]|nr:hypothetical protein [Deltaproteobacteria bacterium]